MTPTRAWDEYVERAKREHGDKLDLSGIAEQFLPYFRRNRVKVTTTYSDTETYTRFGIVASPPAGDPLSCSYTAAVTSARMTC